MRRRLRRVAPSRKMRERAILERVAAGDRTNMEKASSSRGLTIGLSLLFGFVIASVRNDVEGFFIGAILGGVLAQILYLRKRTRALTDELNALRRLTSLRES